MTQMQLLASRTRAGAIVETMRLLKSRQFDYVVVRIDGWDRRYCLRDLRAFVRRAIERRLYHLERGSRYCDRKLDPEYQAGLANDARRIRDYGRGYRTSGRNILTTPELKRRFPHIDNPED